MSAYTQTASGFWSTPYNTFGSTNTLAAGDSVEVGTNTAYIDVSLGTGSGTSVVTLSWSSNGATLIPTNGNIKTYLKFSTNCAGYPLAINGSPQVCQSTGTGTNTTKTAMGVGGIG